MKRVFAILLAVLMLAGCGQSSGAQSNDTTTNAVGDNITESKLKIVCSNFPAYDFVRQIAGENVELSMLLPPGTESHGYEPTPKDIIALQECDVFIYVGGNSDSWLEGILAAGDMDNVNVLKLFDWVDMKEETLVEGMEEEAEEEHSHDIEYDEHVWTSPVNAAKIVDGLAGELSSLDAANKDIYIANSTKYRKQLDELDAGFREIIRNSKRNMMVFGDRFPFRYFADEYGLEYFAAFPGCSGQTEPSAATVAFLIDKVRNEGIPVVFHIEMSSQKMADTIYTETGAKKLLFHSCHNVSQQELDGGATYLSLMQQNQQALKEALQ